MNDEPIEEVARQLNDKEDWLVRGGAIRKLTRFGPTAVKHLPRLFELTFDPKAPIQSDSCALIKRLGAVAVPFLLGRLQESNASGRARAINLLMETGFRKSTTVRLVEQILPDRTDELPEWGCDPEVVLEAIRQRTSDSDGHVRFAAASVLEEFGLDLPELIPVFVETLSLGTLHEKNWAALRLGRIGTPAKAACDALWQAVETDCRYTQLAARNALRRIGCKENDPGGQ